LLGTVPCTCDDQGDINIGDAECFAFIESQEGFASDDDADDDDGVDEGCFCDTLDGEKTCQVFDSVAAAELTSEDVDAFCYTYKSGLFDNTICSSFAIDTLTCTVTIDGTKCNSCEIDSSCFGIDFDCSNVIDGEMWNECTDGDNIPETSPFIFLNEERFLEASESCPVGDAAGGDASGAFALSFHALFMVGLIVIATFW
jgi:hypothetical protein